MHISGALLGFKIFQSRWLDQALNFKNQAINLNEISQPPPNHYAMIANIASKDQDPRTMKALKTP